MHQLVKSQPAVWVFAVALALVVFTAVGADKVAASYRRSAANVSHTREVELHVARARAAFAQAEATFDREATSDTPSVQAYRDHLNEAEAELAQIAFLTSDNPKQQEILKALANDLIEMRRNALGALLPPDPSPSPALQFANADEELKKMGFEEESLLATRIQLSEAEYRRMLVFFRSAFALAALALLWSSFDILRHAARVARAETAMRALNVKLQNAHDEEGRRIGRELHDGVGQCLAAAKMALFGIEAIPDLPRVAKEKAQFAKEATDEAIREIRTVSQVLHPPLLDELGFAVAAEGFVSNFSERSGIVVSLVLLKEDMNLGRETSLALFRTLQVGLSNVHRHSRSKSVELSVVRTAGRVILEIRDFGVGIPAERLEVLQRQPAAAGVGLGGLKERVAQLGGDLEIESDSTGTILRVRLPAPIPIRTAAPPDLSSAKP
jgi:signal transduction histidine kinase